MAKGVWGHLLTYNLVRGLMSVSARASGCHPREISFKGAVQAWGSFWPHLLAARTEAERGDLRAALPGAIGTRRVGDRPGRYEPPQIKRRPKNYQRLTEPRAQARARLLQTT